MIGARFIVSMQQEPGFAARPYLKTRSFRWRALLHVGRHISSTIWPFRVAYYLLGRGVAEQTVNLLSLLPSAPKSRETIAQRSPFLKTAREKKLEVGAVDFFSQDHLESQLLVHG